MECDNAYDKWGRGTECSLSWDECPFSEDGEQPYCPDFKPTHDPWNDDQCQPTD